MFQEKRGEQEKTGNCITEQRHEFAATIQSIIISHTCVAPWFVVAAYAKNTPHSSPSSRLGLLCSDALYVQLFMLLCIVGLVVCPVPEAGSGQALVDRAY